MEFPAQPSESFVPKNEEQAYSAKNPMMWKICAPEIWGSAAWTYMHCAVQAAIHQDANSQFSTETGAALKTLFQSIQQTLPCPKCRAHFAVQLEKLTSDIVHSKKKLKPHLSLRILVFHSPS